MKKFILMAGLLGLIGLGFPIFAENEILFQASFNKGLDADIAKGEGEADQYGVRIISDGEKGCAAELTRSDILSYPGAENFNPDNGTVDFWFKPYWSSTETFYDEADDGQRYHTLFSLGHNDQSDNRMYCWYDDCYNILQFRIDANKKPEAAGAGAVRFFLKANNWHHIACVWENFNKEPGTQNIYFYLNGELKEKKSGLTVDMKVTSQTTIHIGGGTKEDSCNGVIDAFTIYGRAMNEKEVKALFKRYASFDPDEKKERVKNFIKNSSFELTTNKGVPDHWGCHSHFDDLEWYENWGVVENVEPVHGKKCMQIRKPERDGGSSYIFSQSATVPPGVYTLSGYFKSDKEASQISFNNLTLDINDTWKRYSQKAELKKGEVFRVNIRLNTPGILWMDSIQLEPGDIMREYTPDEATSPNLVKKISKIPQDAVAIPKIKCKVIDTPPLIDGKLDEPCWDDFQKLDFILYDTAKPPMQKTYGWILRDQYNLYVGFQCFDSDMKNIKAEKTYHDSGVYLDDCVEVFLVLDSNMEKHFQIMVNTIETVGDVTMTYSPVILDHLWESYAKVKVFKDKDYWSCEIAIPFYALGVSQITPQEWKINLLRENHKANEYSVWSATYDPVYLTPQRFGIVDMGDKKSFAKLFAKLSIDAKDRKLKKVKGVKCADGFVRYSYYSAEKEAELTAYIEGTEKKYVGNVQIYKKDATSNSVLWEKTYRNLVNGENAVKADISSLETGDYRVKLNLFDRKGMFLDSFEDGLVKRAPPPSGVEEVKVDRKRRVALIKGVPFVPFGPLGNFLEGNHYEGIKYVKEKGFNTIVIGPEWRGKDAGIIHSDERIKKAMDEAHKLDMKVVVYFMPMTKYVKSFDDATEIYVPFIKKFKNHPALLGYWFADEPFPDQGIWGRGIEEKETDLLRMYTLLKSEDPYHLASIIWNEFVAQGKFYGGLNASDEILVDRYAFVAPKGGSVAKFLKFVADTENIAVGSRSLSEIILQTYGLGDAPREPTPSEEIMSNYASIIRGFKGFYYYTGRPMSRDLWNSFDELSLELKQLMPVIIDGSDSRKPEINCSGIECLLKAHGGQFYLITVNTTAEEKKVEFNLINTDIRKTKAAEVLFEKRNIDIEEILLKDSYKGYERHVYLFKPKYSFNIKWLNNFILIE